MPGAKSYPAVSSKMSYGAVALAAVLGVGGGGMGAAGLVTQLSTPAPPPVAEPLTREIADIMVGEMKAQADHRVQQLASGPKPVPPPAPEPAPAPVSEPAPPPEPVKNPELPEPIKEPEPEPAPEPEPQQEDFQFQDEEEELETMCEPCPSERMAARAICAEDTNTGLYSLDGKIYECLTDKEATE